MSRSRRLGLAVVIAATAGLCSPATIAQSLNDVGHRGTDAWVVVCDRGTCITTERATSAYFNYVYLYTSQGGASNPVALANNDWATLVTISTARHEAIVEHQKSLAAELCMRSKEIYTQPQLSAALEENVRSTKMLAEAYNEELMMLSLEGRTYVNQRIEELRPFLRTVDLDYATYFAAESIEPAAYFESACAEQSLDQGQTEPEIRRNDSRRPKPDALPLAVFMAPECPVSVELIRQSAEGAISRADIEPLRWPTLQETSPWFGVYVGLECADETLHALRLSLIDSMDGSLILYQSSIDGSDGHLFGHPLSSSPISYSSYVSGAVDRDVYKFLLERLEP